MGGYAKKARGRAREVAVVSIAVIAVFTTVFISTDGFVSQVHSGALFEEDLIAIIESELLG